MRLTGHSLGYGGVAYGAVAVYGTTAATATAVALGGIDAGARRKRQRYIIAKDGKLLEFASADAAERALDDEPIEEAPKVQTKPAPKVKAKAKRKQAQDEPAKPASKAREVAPPAPPLQSIDIAYILALAQMRGRAKAAQEMLERQRYEALLDLLGRMQDEEDIEMLLMAVH